MNRIAYIAGRVTLALGVLAVIAPVSTNLFHIYWG